MLADTSPEAELAQREAQRRLGPQGRFRTACLMSQSMRDLALLRIRSKNPQLDDAGVLAQLMWELYGFRRDTK